MNRDFGRRAKLLGSSVKSEYSKQLNELIVFVFTPHFDCIESSNIGSIAFSAFSALKAMLPIAMDVTVVRSVRLSGCHPCAPR